MTITVKSIAPRYDPTEDRVLLVVNAGGEDEWACWLTRRITVRTLSRLSLFFEQTSVTTKRVPLEYRREAAKLEREAAVARSRKSFGQVSVKQMMAAALRGELATRIKLTPQPNGFVLEISSRGGGQARGHVGRGELHTVLVVLEREARKAGWLPKADARAVQEPTRRKGTPYSKGRVH